ncbi:WDR41 [Branchiostoma lanceolatum]|uniref:WDR41 protein n=2 Tax=Branchiostoma lanceolatum TaxID=7740 RepID=A0A8J9ZJ58_BRALA|nr:WDR41 [Branchiostoma lanceolatum]
MSTIVKRLLRSSDDLATKGELAKEADVPSIGEHQPRNPYTEIQVLQNHSDIVRLLHAVDSSRFVSAGDDGTAILWHTQTGRRHFTFSGHDRPITAMLLLTVQKTSFHDDDESSAALRDPILLTASSDKHICMWNVNTGQCLQTITELHSSVKCMVELRHGMWCSGGHDLSLWSHQGELLHRLDRVTAESDISLVLSIPNEKLVAVSDKTLLVFKVTSPMETGGAYQLEEYGNPHTQHREAIQSLVNVSDSVFATGSLDGTIVLWASARSVNFTRKLSSSARSPQGINHLYPWSIQCVVPVEERYLFAAIGAGFWLYDVVTGKCLAKKVAAHFSKIQHMVLLGEGSFLATCSADGTIRLWGSPGVTAAKTEETTEEQKPRYSKQIDRFMGISPRKEDTKGKSKSVDQLQFQPTLLGELLGHAGTVQMLLDCGGDGLASCGTDGLVILWKDGAVQSEHRNEFIREMLQLGVS